MSAEDLLEVRPGLRRREFLIAGAASGLAVSGSINYTALARARRLPIAAGGSFAGVRDRLPTDFTAHALVSGLKPSHEYHYRFHTKHKNSRVGTFRTLPPADSNQTIRIGYYSCSSYEAGYFTAPAALAREKDLDLVLCLGDYIYEHHYYKGPAARVDRTGKNQDGDVQSLAEYRQKYRFYQSDKDLQAMHAAHPFVAIWDDHEVEDNYAGKSPDSKQSNPALENSGYPRRVPFPVRPRNAYRAFFEAMPQMPHKGDPKQIYSTLRLGKLAELFLTDERQYREPQPCADARLTSCPADLLPGELGISAGTLDALRRAADPHVIFAEFEKKGYGVVTVSKNEVLGEFKTTNTQRPHSSASSLAKFQVAAGTTTLHQV